MSLVRHFFRKLFVFAGIFLFAILAGGCQQTDAGLTSALMTPGGVRAEAFLPQDSFMIFELGPADQVQQTAFSSLLQHFPTDDQQNFQKNVIGGFDKDLTTYGLSYEQDILPAVGNNLRMMAAFEGSPSSQDKPNVYAFVPLEDPSKADLIFQKLVQGKFFTQENSGGGTIYSKVLKDPNDASEEYMSRVNDLLVVTNDLESLKSALDRQKGSQASLLQDSVYQKALRQLKPSVAFAYINLQGIFNVIRQDPTARKQYEEIFTQMPQQNSLDALQGEMFSAQAEAKGLRLYGAVYGDDEKMKNLDQNFLNLPNHEPYLYQKIPGDSVDVYVEGYNLEKVLQYDLSLWSGLGGFAEGFSAVKNAFLQIGLDFDKDFMPMFEQGVAFDIRNNGSVLPSVGLFADVSQHTTEAGKVMGKLQMIVDVILKDIEPNFADSPGLFTNEESDVNGGKAYVVRLHLDKLNPQNSNYAAMQLFLNKPIELWYGVSGDHIAFITFDPYFGQNYGSSNRISQDQNFQHVLEQIKVGSGIGYLSPSTLVDYLNKVFDAAQLASGGKQDSADFAKIKSYLLPFAGMAFTTKPVSAGESHFEGFVLIQ